MDENKVKLNKGIQLMIVYATCSIQKFILKLVMLLGLGLYKALGVNHPDLIEVFIIISISYLSFLSGVMLSRAIDFPIWVIVFLYSIFLNAHMVLDLMQSANIQWGHVIVTVLSVIFNTLFMYFGLIYARQVRSKDPEGANLVFTGSLTITLASIIFFWVLILLVFKMIK